MQPVLRILFLLIGVVVVVVAGVFGLVFVLIFGALFGLLALFGKGRFNVTVNGRTRGSRPAPPPGPPQGDVIDIEATKIETPRTLGDAGPDPAQDDAAARPSRKPAP